MASRDDPKFLRAKAAMAMLEQAGRTPMAPPDLPALLPVPKSPATEGPFLDLDLTGVDGKTERYTFVNLANHHGRSYVSRIRQQRGGTYQTYAFTAAVETLLAIKFDRYRPDGDFLAPPPIDLSEGFAYYVYGDSDQLKLTEAAAKGLPLSSILRDWEWTEGFDQGKADLLARRFGAPNCKVLANQADIANCLRAEAYDRNSLVIKPLNYYKLDATRCIDTTVGTSVACPRNTPYGAPGQRYQVDYRALDHQVLKMLRLGYPVLANVRWTALSTGSDQGLESGSRYHQFKVLTPKPLGDSSEFEPEPPTGPPAKLKDSIIDGVLYNFWPNHQVLIIGYLAGANGRDFYLIKSSHNDVVKVKWNFLRDVYYLVPTPGTSGDLREAGSTRRAFFVHSYAEDKGFIGAQAPYRIIGDVSVSHWGYPTGAALSDFDQDSVVDLWDNCPTRPNPKQEDKDGDQMGDACDPCPNIGYTQREDEKYHGCGLCKDSPPCPSSPVHCRVFDDGYARATKLSNAVYFRSDGTACIDDGKGGGICRKSFGRCEATADGEPVLFSVFDDGESRPTMRHDAIHMAGPRQACVGGPGTSPSSPSTCRKWFGFPHTASGRPVVCELFDDDGHNMVSGPANAIYFRGDQKVCISDGKGTETCRKWFGLCTLQWSFYWN